MRNYKLLSLLLYTASLNFSMQFLLIVVHSFANCESVFHNEFHYPVNMSSCDCHADEEGELLGGHLGGDPDGRAGGTLLHISQVSGARTGNSSDSRGLSEIL